MTHKDSHVNNYLLCVFYFNLIFSLFFSSPRNLDHDLLAKSPNLKTKTQPDQFRPQILKKNPCCFNCLCKKNQIVCANENYSNCIDEDKETKGRFSFFSTLR